MDPIIKGKSSQRKEEGEPISHVYKMKTDEDFSVLRSLTRLMIGGLLTGTNGFISRLKNWENQVYEKNKNEDRHPSSKVPEATETNPINESHPEITEENLNQNGLSHAGESAQNDIRYALIGMAFETQDRLDRSIKTAERLSQAIFRTLSPLVDPLVQSRLFSPARNQFNHLVDRGEVEVRKWIETGQKEYALSKELAGVALYETVDFWIDYFAESPEVVDLVTSQSVGFAGEIVEEVRERTVSADNYLEGLVRVLFRQPSRAELPPPPPEVQMEAYSTKRMIKNKWTHDGQF